MGTLELVTPGDVVELVEGMQDLYVMGTVDGFQKVTKIDGLEDMSALTVSDCAIVYHLLPTCYIIHTTAVCRERPPL